MRRTMISVVVALSAAAALPALAQDLAVAVRNAVNLGTSATDQHGQTFPVTGLSGITHLAGDVYWAVMDNSDKLVRLSIALGPDGSIAAASITGGLTLAMARDYEDLAFTGPGRNTVLVCDEDGPQVHEFSLANGSLVRTVTPPPVFANRRANFGFEALTLDASGTVLWVANEEALTVDGPVSTPSAGTRVRLQCFDVTPDAITPGPQHGYLTAPMHAGNITGGRSGLSAMVLLPSGRLLGMERSFANNIFQFFETRVYEITTSGASDTGALASLLDPHTPAEKRLLYRGNQTNLEGLCLGPRVGAGYALLGIVDDGDPISVNRLVSFVVSGPVDAPCLADFNGDGFLDFFDYDAFVACFETGDCPPGRADADFNGDGFADFFDYDAFVEGYEGGC